MNVSERSTKNNAEAIGALYEIADDCLFGSGEWPASREATSAFNRIARSFGLNEYVQGSLPGTTRFTPLGIELKVELMMMFAGCWELDEIPHILADNGYIDWSETDELWELPTYEFERELRVLVKRAYLEFCGRFKLLH
jgi:hypothetical protein